MSDYLYLNRIDPNRRWHIQPTSAVTGEGLHQGMDWLSQELNISLKISK
jgi:hypothetical protein